MSRADIGVERFGSVEVVVVRVDTGVLESLCLTVLEEPEAGADLDVGTGCLDLLDHPRDALDVPVRRTASGRDEADPRGSPCQTEFRLPLRLILRQP